MNFNGGLASLETVTGTAAFSNSFSVVVYGNTLLEDTSGFPLSITAITGEFRNVMIGANPLLCYPSQIVTASFWTGVSLFHGFIKSNFSFDFLDWRWPNYHDHRKQQQLPAVKKNACAQIFVYSSFVVGVSLFAVFCPWWFVSFSLFSVFCTISTVLHVQ